ncbi:type IV secretion system protein VirB6 [Rhizobiales bacterium GAS191]|nr:type IV secretion system protein VirB6 [Rhizobiales bacterium GAS191]
MNSDVVSQIVSAVANMGSNVVQTIYQSISAGFAPVFWMAVTIYIAWWGYEMMFGRSRITAGEMVWKIVRIAIVYSLAFGWGDFQSMVVNGLQGLTSGMGNAVCQAVANAAPSSAGSANASGLTGSAGTDCTGNGSNSSSAVTSTLTQVWNSSMAAINNIKGSGWTGGVGAVLIDLVLTIMVVVFIGYATFLIIVGILATQALLGIAPIFITAALFGFTSRFFDGWLRAVAGFALAPMIVYAFVGFMAVLLQNQATTLVAAGSDPSMVQIAPFALMCVIACFLLTQALPIGAMIAGGHGMQVGGLARGILAAPAAAAGMVLGGLPGAAAGAWRARSGGKAAAAGGAARGAFGGAVTAGQFGANVARGNVSQAAYHLQMVLQRNRDRGVKP